MDRYWSACSRGRAASRRLFGKLQRSLQEQRQRETLAAQSHRIVLRSRSIPWSLDPCSSQATRHRSPWSGIWAWPAPVETVQAATEGRHSSQPLASPASKVMVWVRGAIGASGACSSSRPSDRMEAIFPPNWGTTVTEQSPAWMRTFSFCRADKLRLHPVTSAISGRRCRLAVYASQMRSSQASCSGFISTDRRQVTFRRQGAAQLAGRNQCCGNCTSAKMQIPSRHMPQRFAGPGPRRSPTVPAASFQTTMSSSGGPRGEGLKRLPSSRGAAGPARGRQPARWPAPAQIRLRATSGNSLLRGPQRHRRGPGAGTLQADLAKMQLIGSEVGVRRVVLVEAAHGGVAEEHAAASVRLQPVLVRVDDDRVGLIDHRNRPAAPARPGPPESA